MWLSRRYLLVFWWHLGVKKTEWRQEERMELPQTGKIVGAAEALANCLINGDCIWLLNFGRNV